MGGAQYQSAPPAYLMAEHLSLLTGETREVKWGSNEEAVPYINGLIEPTYTPLNFKAIFEHVYNQGSPYSDVGAYDPWMDLDYTEDALFDFTTVIDAWEPDADWDSAIDLAAAKADELMLDPTALADALSIHTSRTNPAYLNQVAQVSGSIYRVGSAEGSALPIGLALLAAERAKSLDEFSTTLELEQQSKRLAFISQEAANINNARSAKRQGMQNVFGMKADLATKRIVAGKEFVNEEMSWAVKDAQWELDLFQYGVSMMGAISGAPMLQPGPDKLQTQMSMLLSAAGVIGPLIVGAL